mmetsp:Transcript_4031/g.14358  ORF Transcript_4031/g.14358 Transcript_4031/m.14358 type:complete len:301 (-) Transcript_4031:1239-2141(-)
MLDARVGYIDACGSGRRCKDGFFKIPTLKKSSERTRRLEHLPLGKEALKYVHIVNDVAAAPEIAHRRVFMEEHHFLRPEPRTLGRHEAWEENLTASTLLDKHFENELIALRPACPFVAFTVIRHPADFYISYWKHFLTHRRLGSIEHFRKWFSEHPNYLLDHMSGVHGVRTDDHGARRLLEKTVHSLRQMHLVGVTRCLEETMEILLNMVGASGLYASVGRENTGHTVGVPASSQHAIDQLEREMIQTMIDNPQHWALDLELFRPFARALDDRIVAELGKDGHISCAYSRFDRVNQEGLF